MLGQWLPLVMGIENAVTASWHERNLIIDVYYHVGDGAFTDV